MYGTVARLRLKPNAGEQLEGLMAEYESLAVPGHVATYLYRLDSDSDDHYLVVMFEDRESYRRNAEDPAQDERYRRMRDLLAEDPKWHDGEVVLAHRYR
jgi:quinol monooxygenase YgiN